MPTILVVEDEPAMQRGLKDNLEFEKFDVEVVGDGETALERLAHHSYDLIILDVMLPGISGLEVCKGIRQQGTKTPVLMLTAKGEEIDKVLGLELGADDYITKPFGVRELLARIKAVLRRSEGSIAADAEKLVVDDLEIDFASYTATLGGAPVALTPKEVEIMKYMWQRKNKTVTRDELLNKVWGYDESINTRTVDNFILKLRQKIERDPGHPRLIITMHGVGYKLIA